MTDKEKKLLSRQLADQAKLLETKDGGELAAALTLTCCALLKAARGMGADESFDEVYFGYIQLSEELEAFFSDMEQQIEREQNADDEYIQVQERLKAARARSEEARTARMRAESALKELQEQTERENKKLEAAQEELAQLKENHKTFLDMMEDYSPEKIAEQKHKNEDLIAVYHQSREILGQLEEDQKEQEDKNREILRKIKALEASIKQLPERNKELARTYQEKDACLTLLRKAETECSLERQTEMQAEIDRLRPITAQLRQDMETLQQCLTDLEGQSTQYNDQRHTLTTNVLELWQKAMADLRAATAEHEEAIAQLDAEARTLTQRLKACQSTYDRYRLWLEADTTPLQAMMDAVGRPESEKLKETLDPGGMERVKRLLEQIKGDLEELDQILDQCSRAVNMDQRTLKQRARGQAL